MKSPVLTALVLSVIIHLPTGTAAASQIVPGAVPEAVARQKLATLGRLPATNHLRVAIGFPVRDREGLSRLLEDMYRPGSAQYRQYLTPREFAEHFGEPEMNYQAVVAFAKAHGLTISRTHANRLLLVLDGSVANIEKAFHVRMFRYWDPEQDREFYAPDGNPRLDLDVPVQQIDGLNNYAAPVAMALAPQPRDGSGMFGDFAGVDFRTAYASGVTESGTGQFVGLVEFAGFYPDDIASYEDQFGLPHANLVVVPVDGYATNAGTGGEAPGDIQMVLSMATNLAAVVVFEANGGGSSLATWNDMLSLMASSNQIKQFSCSWRLSAPATNATGDQIFQEMGVQGQSFFKASGDGDAYVVNPIPWPNDNPYITLVGGTKLTMSGSGSAYLSEQVWNPGYKATEWGGNGPENYWGSGGGVSPSYSRPSYQRGVSMISNGGSTTMRNLPDVAMVASQINVFYADGTLGSFEGTSFAAPLWAGFMALVNQRASSLHLRPVGFANPALYAIGSDKTITNAFHDITVGTNEWPGSPTNYAAVTGYDLCTGWGSPNGTNLIAALIAQLTLLYQPRFISEVSFGTTLILQSTQGVPNGAYTLLSSTNLMLPVSQWRTNAAGNFNSNGTATHQVPIDPSVRNQFFRLQLP